MSGIACRTHRFDVRVSENPLVDDWELQPTHSPPLLGGDHVGSLASPVLEVITNGLGNVTSRLVAQTLARGLALCPSVAGWGGLAPAP